MLVTERDAIRVRELADSVGLASSTGLVALNVVARQENTVARDNLARFQQRNIANDDLLNNNEYRGENAQGYMTHLDVNDLLDSIIQQPGLDRTKRELGFVLMPESILRRQRLGEEFYGQGKVKSQMLLCNNY